MDVKKKNATMGRQYFTTKDMFERQIILFSVLMTIARRLIAAPS